MQVYGSMRYLHRTKTAVERTVWRYAFQASLCAFVIQRTWAALDARGGREEPVIVACLALQAVAGLLTGACLVAERFVTGALVLLGITVTLTGMVFVLVSGGMSASLAVTQVFFAVLATMMLALFLRGPR